MTHRVDPVVLHRLTGAVLDRLEGEATARVQGGRPPLSREGQEALADSVLRSEFEAIDSERMIAEYDAAS